MIPKVNAFFDQSTFTFTYIVNEPNGKHCAIIDSVLGFDIKSGHSNTESADQLIAFVQTHGLTVDWILETHVHADHLSAASYLKKQLGGRIAIGEHIIEVQKIFAKLFNAGAEFATDGSQFDHLFKNDEQFFIGSMPARVMHTPGHTPACITYIIGDAVFVGDTLFMPDYGTARTDFPGGDAAILYRSISKILALPENTRMFMCHDYGTRNRDYAWESTVKEQRCNNIHVHRETSEEDFIKLRNERDRTLAMPVLLLPSIQINMRAGHFPAPEDNGVSYLKLPLNTL